MGLLFDGNDTPKPAATQTPAADPYGGVSPELRRMAGLQALGQYGAILLAAGQAGPIGQRGQILAQLGNVNPMSNLVAAQKVTSEGADIQAKNQELTMRREQIARQAQVASYLSGTGGAPAAPGAVAPASAPVVAEPAPTTVTPAIGSGRIADVVDVPMTAPGPSAATAPGGTAAPAVAPAPAPLSAPGPAPQAAAPAPQAGAVPSTPLLATLRAATQGDQSALAALGLQNVQQAKLLGAKVAVDLQGGLKELSEQMNRPRIINSRDLGNGKIIQTDQFGRQTTVDAQTFDHLRTQKQMEADINTQAEIARQRGTAGIVGTEALDTGARVQTDALGRQTVLQAPTIAQSAAVKQAEANVVPNGQIAATEAARAAKEAEGTRTAASQVLLDQNKELRGSGIKALEDGQTSARAASATLETINQMRELIGKGVYAAGDGRVLDWTNPTERARADSILQKWAGVDPNKLTDADRTAALQSLGRQLAKDMVKGLGSNPSNADLKAAMEMAGSDPDRLTEKQMLAIFGETEKQNFERIESYNNRRSSYGKQLSDPSALDANFPEVSNPGRFLGVRPDSNGVPHRVYVGRDGKFLRAEPAEAR